MNYNLINFIIKNINSQKQKVNNNNKYTEKEKEMILKGLNMAIDRIWGLPYEDDEYRKAVGLPIFKSHKNET